MFNHEYGIGFKNLDPNIGRTVVLTTKSLKVCR